MTTLYNFCKHNNKEYLLDEWDYELNNNNINPRTIHSGSHTRVWWKCSKCGYNWQTAVRKRTEGSKCPCCLNRVAVIGINDLMTTHPGIAKDWHPIKNGILTPKNVTSGSNKRVWWQCKICGYEWQTSINSRVSGNTGCKNCHRFKNKNIENSLEKTHPEIAQDWDFSKNKNHKPSQYRKGSNFLAWWKCHICGHEIQRPIHDYNGCSRCKALSRIKKEDLLISNKELMSEWDYELNKGIDPTILSKGSNKKIWWVCSYCGNEWQTTIYHRAIKSSGCPKCRHTKRMNYGNNNNLLDTNPEIAKDWHPTKNGKLKPEMFSKNSNYQIWWKCHICKKEIYTEIKNYNGCINCKKQARLNAKNLNITHSNLLSEWDYNKNSINPTEIFASSPKKVWWKCSKCGYEWQSKINNRALLGRGCPCCSNKTVVGGINDLATTHPEIAKDWHPTKNGDLTPQKVVYGSGKKVWWLCPQGHEYQATVLHRTQDNGTGCPICNSGRQTSFAEQAVYYYVKKLYPDAINRYNADFLGRMELDIYIPSINYAIEYDGEAWHRGDAKLKREEKKYKLCKSKNIKLVRLRETEAPLSAFIADIQLCRNKLYEYSVLEHTIQLLLEHLNFSSIGCPIDVNIKRDKQEILQYKTIEKKNSLQDKYPNIAKDWHPTKNGNLKPNMFKPRSGHKVWWQCPICGYEYEATIGHRTMKKNSTGCPICGIEKSAKAKRKAVNMINPDTNQVIKTFISISDAQKQTNIRNISMVCNGLRPKAGGYKWEYAK